MKNDIQISDDGTIFRIKDDGTILKLGKIEGDKIVGPENNTNTASSNVWLWVLGISLIIILFAFLISFSQESSQRHNLEYEVTELKYEATKLKEEVSTVKKERDSAIAEFSDFKNNLGKSLPFFISDVEIGNAYYDGNIETQYGSKIISSSTMYLQPRISYVGIVAGNRKIDVKIFDPNGILRTGTYSPAGYSYSDNVYVGNGREQQILSGWGGSKKGHWNAGNYRLELWYNNMCIYTKEFKIYNM